MARSQSVYDHRAVCEGDGGGKQRTIVAALCTRSSCARALIVPLFRQGHFYKRKRAVTKSTPFYDAALSGVHTLDLMIRLRRFPCGVLGFGGAYEAPT